MVNDDINAVKKVRKTLLIEICKKWTPEFKHFVERESYHCVLAIAIVAGECTIAANLAGNHTD